MPASNQSALEQVFSKFPAPYWSAPGAALYLGDVRTCLRELPARSVHCMVTSPPYWGLRDYVTGVWEGGSADCDHIESTAEQAHRWSTLGPTAAQRSAGDFSRMPPASNAAFKAGVRQYKSKCKKCGAKRIDQQIGAEPSPDCGTHGQARCGGCFVCSMVEVFAEVRRVLRDDGTLWLNLGDTFDNGQLLIPARVALALSANGWKLVQDIIWYAPNKMPESVTNRCTKSHEHILLLAKGNDYYYDAAAIQETAKSKYRSSDFIPNSAKDAVGDKSSATQASRHGRSNEIVQQDVNKRDVWIVPTQGYPGAHFAVYSPRLITPCILAGTSEYGCCAACGKTYERVVVRTGSVEGNGQLESRDRSFPSQRNGLPGSGSTLDGNIAQRETIGWRKMCGCQTDEVVPAVVLDPFVGSGTTVATSIELGRAGVGIDLSEVYLKENAIPRIEAAMNGERVPRKPVIVAQTGTPPPPRQLRG